MLKHNTKNTGAYSSLSVRAEEMMKNSTTNSSSTVFSRVSVSSQSKLDWASTASAPNNSTMPSRRHVPPANKKPNYANGLANASHHVEDKVISARPEVVLGSAKVDLHSLKTLHVTARCRLNEQAGGTHCGATHCGLGATIEDTLQTNLHTTSSGPVASAAKSPSNTDSVSTAKASNAVAQKQSDLGRAARVQPKNHLPAIVVADRQVPMQAIGRKRSIDLSGLDEILDGSTAVGRTAPDWQMNFQSIRNRFGRDEDHPEGRATRSNGVANSQTLAVNTVVEDKYSSSTLPRRRTSDDGTSIVFKSKSIQDALDKFDSTGDLYRHQQPYFSRHTYNLSGLTIKQKTSNSDNKPTQLAADYGSLTTVDRSSVNTDHSVVITFTDQNSNSVQPVSRDCEANATLPRWRQKLAERTGQTGFRPAVSMESPSKRHSEPPAAFPISERLVHDSQLPNAPIVHKGVISSSAGKERPEPLVLHTAQSDTHDGATTTTSPMPRADGIISDTTISGSAGPTGLPQPKPRHHLLDQMLSVGVELPRSPRGGVATVGGTLLCSFPLPTTGAVAARVQDFERKRSSNKTVHDAANGTTAGQLMPAPPVSQLKGFQPTVYRTKPVIHLNVATVQPAPVSSTAESVDWTQVKHQAAANQRIAAPKTPASSASPGRRADMAVIDEQKATLVDSPMERLTRGFHSKLQMHDSLPSTSSAVTSTTTNRTTTASIADPSRISKSAAASSERPPDVNLPATKKQQPVPHPVSHKPASAARPREHIPRFHFPSGRPSSKGDNETLFKRAAAIFNQQTSGKISMHEVEPLMKACNLPLYAKVPLFQCCAGTQRDYITFQDFSSYWKRMTESCFDDAAKFVFTLSRGARQYLERGDFDDMIQDIIETYPGLYFLKDVPDFHNRYVQTVISRIFFCVNRSWSGKITPTELRRSNFLQSLRLLEETEDINSVTDFFSYEHFYVIYCKFWELDQDHDLFISKSDLARHAHGGISPLIIDRVFSGAVSTATTRTASAKMSYSDFVTFIIAEEDKKHPTSVEYWFRCLDLDGDGVLSMWELQTFYAQIQAKMDASGIENMSFEDVLCQILDFVNPRDAKAIRLSDLKRCGIADHFYNTFVNANKYYEQETSDGDNKAAIKSETGEEMSEWERFCAEEYELLMQDEQQAAEGSGDDEDVAQQGSDGNDRNGDSDEDVLQVANLQSPWSAGQSSPALHQIRPQTQGLRT